MSRSHGKEPKRNEALADKNTSQWVGDDYDTSTSLRKNTTSRVETSN